MRHPIQIQMVRCYILFNFGIYLVESRAKISMTAPKIKVFVFSRDTKTIFESSYSFNQGLLEASNPSKTKEFKITAADTRILTKGDTFLKTW